MSFGAGGDAGAGAGAMADKEVQEFVMMEEQKAQFMMQEDDERTLEVVVGTYEELSLGYRLVDSTFQQTFTDHSHAGCVRSAAVSQNGILATGSSDEMIRLFNIRRKKELGSLVHHEGHITWLEFYKNSHMFSCSGDGTIGLWDAKTWECLRTFRGHKGTVNCCSFHPSGKLALSVGEDKTMRLWNLITGRSAYISSNVKNVAQYIAWSCEGDYYLLVQDHVIAVYKTEGASLEREFTCKSRIHAIQCTKDGNLLVGVEEGLVKSYELTTGRLISETKAHDNRVKAMKLLEVGYERTLVTASSDSKIKVWNVVEDDKLILKAEVDTKFRIVSMGAWFRRKIDSKRQVQKKTKVEEDIENESEDEKPKEEPEKKKAKVEVEYETSVSPRDKLARRLLRKDIKKKGNRKKGKN